MKKKLCAGILACVMLLTGVPAWAAENPTDSSVQTAAETAASASPSKEAQLLYDLHLLKGTNKGFEEEKTMYRSEAAVMLTRLLGGEKEALRKKIKPPFTDVPAWASPYVGWLYQKGLTKGTGGKKYSPNQTTTYGEYVLFLGRSLGWTDQEILSGASYIPWWNGYYKHEKETITRGKAIAMSVEALEAERNNGQTLAAYLMYQNVFTREEINQAATPKFSSKYITVEAADKKMYVERWVFGITVAKAAKPGYLYYNYEYNVFGTSHDFIASEIPTILSTEGYEVSALDPLTLQETGAKITMPATGHGIRPVFNGKNYVLFYGYLTSDTGTLYKTDGKTIESLDLDIRSYHFQDTPQVFDDRLVFCGEGGVGLFDGRTGTAEKLRGEDTYSTSVLDGKLYYVPDESYLLDQNRAFAGGHKAYQLAADGTVTLLTEVDPRYCIAISRVKAIEGDTVYFESDMQYQESMDLWNDMVVQFSIQNGRLKIEGSSRPDSMYRVEEDLRQHQAEIDAAEKEANNGEKS